MDWTTIAGRALLGGLFIGIVLGVSQTRLSFLAGMLLFFPFISVPTFYFMGIQHGPEKVREAIVWGALSIPVWGAFAVGVYWASSRMGIIWSLAVGLAGWFAAAGLLVAGRFWLQR